MDFDLKEEAPYMHYWLHEEKEELKKHYCEDCGMPLFMRECEHCGWKLDRNILWGQY